MRQIKPRVARFAAGMFSARGVALALVLFLALLASGCGGAKGPRGAASAADAFVTREYQQIRAEAWPEADTLFRHDPDWLGGDGAFSIDLGGDRTLWLFGDSLIATNEARARRESEMVRNTIAIQSGRNPSSASMRFYWRANADGSPGSFFSQEGDVWFWPAHGLCVDGRLTIFLYRMADDEGPTSLGFRVVGWTAVRVNGPHTDPREWKIRKLAAPDTSPFGTVGAAVIREGDHVHAYVVREPGNQDIMVLRWRNSEFDAGDLESPEWWGGPENGWGSHPPAVVMQEGATEFSVSDTGASPRMVQVQTHGFGPGNLALRFAPRLTGPWTRLRDVYRPPEVDRPELLVYAAKAHPHLEGADLVATYVSNAFDPDVVVGDDSVYFPRFVRISFRPNSL